MCLKVLKSSFWIITNYLQCSKIHVITVIFFRLRREGLGQKKVSSNINWLKRAHFPVLYVNLNYFLFAVCHSYNPIALRMAKTPLSFGHSECNRVKGIYL